MKSLAIIFVLLLFTSLAQAQIQSAAFDPNCYQPRIGQEIDTIVGGRNGQELGFGLINIGPSPDNPSGAGRLMMGRLPGTLGDSSEALLNVGLGFNPRNLNLTKMPGFKFRNPVPGHFRSPRYMDILAVDPDVFLRPRIYWQKDDGTYDTSYYSILAPDPSIADTQTELEAMLWLNPPYHAHLTSDSAEDIVIMYKNGILYHRYADSAILCHFSGGANLFHPHEVVVPDSKLYFDTATRLRVDYLLTIGDFRGTGREDVVLMDSSRNLMFYPNDRPFSLERFKNAIRSDTFFSMRRAPSWVNPSDFSLRLSLQTRDGAPASVLVCEDSAYLQGDWTQLRIFKGSPVFGSHQLSLEDAAVIHTPKMFDNSGFRDAGWADAIADFGNMTGTGDHVLCVEGGFGPDLSFHTFYVLGDSIDEKVDMFFDEAYGGVSRGIDSATLDGDRYGDAAIALANYPASIVNGKSDRGSLLFVHGSDKIPTKVKKSVRRLAEDPSTLWVTTRGNILSAHVPIRMAGERCHVVILDILGRCVTEEWVEYSPIIKISVPPCSVGTYVLQISGGDQVYQAKLVL